MKKFKSLMLKLGTIFTIAVASIINCVCLAPKNVSRGGGYQNSIDEVASDLNSDNDNNGVGTNVGVNNNTNNNSNNNTNKTPIKQQTFNFNEGEIVVQKGSGEIKYEYTPDNTQTATSVAYQYRFNNSMKVDMGVNLKSISTTSVTLSYAYSDTKLDTISSSNSVFEAQRISPNATKYIYIVVTPTSTSIPSTFQSSIVWYQGEAGILSIDVNGEITNNTIVKGQIVEEPSITIPDGAEFEGWFLDEGYATEATFPFRSQGQSLYVKMIVPNLPDDWLAYNSSTKTYYVTTGTSALPENLIIPSTYNGYAVSEVGGIYNQTNLKTVFVPNGVTTLSGFYGCDNLEKLSVPNSITYIYRDIGSDCPNLKFNEYSNAYYLGNDENPYVLLMSSINDSITSCIVHPNTTVINFNAFYGCSSLTNLDLTQCTSLVRINSYAFAECAMTSLTIPASVTRIGNEPCYQCTNLTSVTFADPKNWYDGDTQNLVDVSTSSKGATCLLNAEMGMYKG